MELHEIGDDLFVSNIVPRDSAPGMWVAGTLNGHSFEALVFDDHASCPDWELGQSRISKLWIQRLADRRTVFNWDRGPDQPAANETVQKIVDFLAEGLADYVSLMTSGEPDTEQETRDESL